MTEPAPEDVTVLEDPDGDGLYTWAQAWATTQDVVDAMGKIGPRVQSTSSVDLAAHLSIARAEAAGHLAKVYGATLPTFTSSGLEVVRWAVAKLAASRVLDILRASLDTASDVPERLRASAERDLTRPVPGYPAGATLDDTGQPVEDRPVARTSPTVGYGAPGSAFPDPYERAEVWRGTW